MKPVLARRRHPRARRALTTILFTDIVASTDLAQELGDRAWRELLMRHHMTVRKELKRFGGREIDTAGDGFLVTFTQPERAVRCACATADALRALGIEIRAGIHFGEVQAAGKQVQGVAVHAAARLLALANPGEIVVSGTLKELVAGSGLAFADYGSHSLKGLEGRWQLYLVTAVDGKIRNAPLEATTATARRTDAVRGTPAVSSFRGRRGVVAATLATLAISGVAAFFATRDGVEHDVLRIRPESIVRIDPGSRKVTAVIPVGLTSSDLAVVGDENLWVFNGQERTMSVVRTSDSPRRLQSFGVQMSSYPYASIAFGEGSVWIPSHESVLRINPATRTSVHIPVEGQPVGIAVGDGMVWANNERQDTAVRIDPGTDEVVRTVNVGEGSETPAIGEGSVWIPNWRDGTLTKIDPRSDGTTTLSVADNPLCAVIGFGSVWVVSGIDGEIDRIAPATGHITRVPITPFGTATSGSCAAAGPDSMWVLDPSHEAILGIDPISNVVTQRIDLPYVPEGIVAANGSLWVMLTSLGGFGG